MCKKEQQPQSGESQPGSEDEVKKAEAPAAKAALSDADYQALVKEKEALQAELAKWKNEYYLCLADTQNLRKSLENDHREALKYRSQGFLENLLPALDSFYLALGSKPQSTEAQNYQQGFTFIYNQIQASLQSEGVSEVVPKLGDPYDATTMHAVDVVPGGKDGTIAKVYAKGYKLYDRLIRPAMVSVYQQAKTDGPQEKKAEAATKDSQATKA